MLGALIHMVSCMYSTVHDNRQIHAASCVEGSFKYRLVDVNVS